jgi:beta-glucanase (GH16 family)
MLPKPSFAAIAPALAAFLFPADCPADPPMPAPVAQPAQSEATPAPAAPEPPPPPTPPPKFQTVLPSPDYVLVWTDEFDATVLDETKWSHYALGPRRDAVNVREAVALDGKGHLVMTTSRAMVKQEDGSEKPEYKTGMISTLGKFETTYGYFECRMKLQKEVGHWSAFWINTPTMGNPVGDPAKAGVEIDVIEYLRNADYGDKVNHTIHWDHKTPKYERDFAKLPYPGIGEGFHTFGCEWTPDVLVFYVDGKETWRTSKAIPKRDQYMILSLEVGKWADDIAQATLPDSIEVDYVRVFKKKAEVERPPEGQTPKAEIPKAEPAPQVEQTPKGEPMHEVK